jgi:predicted transcriptional regulator
MSLNVSPEVEAHVLAQAEQAGLSVDDYLENLVSQDEQLIAAVRSVESKSELPPRDELRAKLDRGLAEMKRGEYVDGEQFMAELLSGLDDDAERLHPSG